MSRVQRVGLVADTHVGEYLDALPEALFEALDGCHLVLHAGDLSVPSVLDELDRIAPVVAVRGDHDRLGGLRLPRDAVVRVAGHRIGLSHGDRALPVDAGLVAVHLLAPWRIGWNARLYQSMLKRLGAVDCLVHGHWHDARVTRHGSTLVVAPGAVCPWGSLEGGRPVGRGWAGLADRAVWRVRRKQGIDRMRPRVAVLEVGSAGIRPILVPIGPGGIPPLHRPRRRP